MKNFKAIIIDQVGLHARPASELVQVASKFASEIKLIANGKEANAKSLITIMSLGVKKDTEIEIIANGSDEEAAIDAIKIKLSESKVIG